MKPFLQRETASTLATRSEETTKTPLWRNHRFLWRVDRLRSPEPGRAAAPTPAPLARAPPHGPRPPSQSVRPCPRAPALLVHAVVPRSVVRPALGSTRPHRHARARPCGLLRCARPCSPALVRAAVSALCRACLRPLRRTRPCSSAPPCPRSAVRPAPPRSSAPPCLRSTVRPACSAALGRARPRHRACACVLDLLALVAARTCVRAGYAFCICEILREADNGMREEGNKGERKKSDIYYAKTLPLCELDFIYSFCWRGLLNIVHSFHRWDCPYSSCRVLLLLRWEVQLIN
jgi:hypothetical protein